MEIVNSNPDCGIMTFFIHNTCNFKCSYCNEEHYGGSHRWPEGQTWDNYLDLIDDMKEKNKYLYIELLGGEPTLWPKFHEFVEYISDKNTFIEYETNGSRTLRYWNKLKPHQATAHFSWHNEFTDDEHYLDVLEIMQDKVDCTAVLMMVPKAFDRARRMYDRIVQRGLRIEVIPKYTRINISRSGYMEYDEEQHKWLTTHYYNEMKRNSIDWNLRVDADVNGERVKLATMINQGMYRFKGWTCTAGIKRLFVDVDGEIYRCTKQVGGSLGNINTVWQLPTTNITCDTDKDCACKLETIISKWK